MPEILIPEAGIDLWNWFWDMGRDRHQGMNGPQPIGLAGIDLWSRLTGTPLRVAEVAILRDMDDAYRSAYADESDDQSRRREAESKRR